MRILTPLLIFSAALIFVSCGSNSEQANNEAEAPKSMVSGSEDQDADWKNNKGIGPVKNVSLDDDIDEELAQKGEELYNVYCMACHKPDEKFIGPAPKGILNRRTPEWVMNMILNPEVMVKDDPIAKELLIEYNYAPMANQGLKEDEARAILEYFRTL